MNETKLILQQLEQTARTWKSDLQVTNLAAVLYEQVDSPTSLGLYLCIKYGDILELVRHRVHPSNYLDSVEGLAAFRWDYQCCSLLAKYPFKGVCDTKAAAVVASGESEIQCRKANDRISDWLEGGNAPSERVASAILLARDRVAQILGPFCPRTWLDQCRFGPGVSAERKETQCYDKLTGSLGINPAGYHLAVAMINSSHRWKSTLLGYPFDFCGPLPEVRKLDLMDYGVRAYVPKSATTDRPIEIQPGYSVYLQLGIGQQMRDRLRFAGVDLDKGWEKNQLLAKQGSIDDSLVTVDLKSASDSICFSLVNWIMPSDWLEAMVLCRPRFLLEEDRLVETERFSSMGNGYTFELESLIFYSLAWACSILSSTSRRNIAVFGDDIIVEKPAWPLLSEVFSFLGFQTNGSKSFVSGAFRESCGADWYLGVDISPLRITTEVIDVQTTLELANRVRRYSCLHGRSDHCDKRWRPMWLYIVKSLPPSVRRYQSGPSDLFGDGWLHDDQDRYLQNPLFRGERRWGYDRMWIRVPRLVLRSQTRTDLDTNGVLAAMLYTASLRRRLDSEAIDVTYRSRTSRDALLRISRLSATSSGDGYVKIPTFRPRVRSRIRAKWIPLHTPLTSLWL